MDPNRRAVAAQESRLAELRAEVNYRSWAYAQERTVLETRRELLKKRLAAAPAKAPTTNPADAETDATASAISSLNSQITLLNGRIDRLKTLGAVASDKAPTTAPAAKPNPEQTALIEAGSAFDIAIEDPDLKEPTVEVRVRSMGGRLIDSVTISAKRDDGGVYRAHVQTDRGEAGQKGLLSVVPGGEIVADYQNKNRAPQENVDRVSYLALASDATLAATNANFTDQVSKVRLGEPVYVQVINFAADRSPGINVVAADVTSSSGDRLTLILSETEPHSGIFRGKFYTDAGAPNPNDDVLQAAYGGSVQIVYRDYLRQDRSQSLERKLRLEIAGGTDGIVEAFSRQFKDAQEEMKLWYRTGQSAYQIGRRLYLAGGYERAEEYFIEANDYFSHLVSRFPEEALAASANYYLGNIQSLKGNHREALLRFQEIVTRWPKSDFVAKARFKVGQAYEAMGQFEQAADAYVLLTYHHPDDAHVPMAMIRMMNYYARGEQYADAVAIAQKFVEKFPKQEQAGAVALKAGQWLAVAEKLDDALAWFAQAEKTFATNDKDMPALLYWHAATLIQMQTAPKARLTVRPDKIRELLNRVIYDYGKSEYVNLARAAMEQVPLNQ